MEKSKQEVLHTCTLEICDRGQNKNHRSTEYSLKTTVKLLYFFDAYSQIGQESSKISAIN